MRKTVCVLALLLVVGSLAVCAESVDVVRVGILTDVHVHDGDSPGEHKVMTNYPERLSAFVDAMNAWPADGVLQLGDLVNGNFVLGGGLGDPARIGTLLKGAVALLAEIDGPLYHVLGNHDMYDLSKTEVLAAHGLEAGYYSFDLGGFHFVVLDAEFNPDGTDYDHVFMRTKGLIPPDELAWLVADLGETALPTIVCLHQPLDVDFEALAGGPPVTNHLDVRRALADSGVVVAVFQGHDHENRLATIDGIHYVTFAAMVDDTEPKPPTWAYITLDPIARTISIVGEGEQADYELQFGEAP